MTNKNCKCPACNPINQPNFEYVAPRKLTLKERIHKQRMENFAASDRAFEYVQANQERYAEHRASILAERKMVKTGYLDVIERSVTNVAHYVGGVTKSVGDTITGGVEALIDEPSMIADAANNIGSTVVDGITYFPDVLVSAIAPGLSTGAKERTNQRINDLVDGVSDSFEQAKDDLAKHNQALASGDYEAAGAIVGGYASSIVLPAKKVKVLGGSPIDVLSFEEKVRKVKISENGKVIIQFGPNAGKEKNIILSSKANTIETRNGITLKRDKNGFPIFNSKFDTHVPDELLGNQDAGSHFKYANEQLRKQLETNKGLGKELGLTKEQVKFFLKDPSLKSSPDGVTWHHHQDTGRMQLVDTLEHEAFVPHTGGMSIWGGGYKR